MTDCRLLTIVLIVAVVAIVFFVFGGCRVECDAKADKKEGFDQFTNVRSYEFADQPQMDAFNYKYGMAKKHFPLELGGYGAYQAPTAFLGLPEDVGPQACGPCQ
ncbi:membrane protein [Noumeavirus]|uniref:Membrane protein n=1 Tax=Marseillevirus sp. TaxID=2809551 RepID=A0AA96IY50_9VIRU|nr:membrane protein [Noumeavirus]AQM73179.1 membrane protein [Noumeavirus]QZX43805.1 membrane protein [Marseillevirus sp.]WNL50368.1 membrane protein [Marseillevirus sp.]